MTLPTCPPSSAFSAGVLPLNGTNVMLDLGHQLELLESNVLGTRGADAGVGQLARLGARRIEPFGECLIGRRAVDDDNLRRVGQQADRLEAGQRIVAQLLEVGMDDERVGDDPKRVAVRHGAGGGFDAEHGRGAGTVFDDGCDAVRLRPLFCDHAGQYITAATSGKRHDEFDLPGGLRERARSRSCGSENSRRDESPAQPAH